MLNPVDGPIHTGNAPDQGPSNTVTKVLVAQHLKRRDRMLRFLFLFPYIQCPHQGLNSVTAHVRTGKFPYREKAPSGLSTLFHIRRVGASLLDLPHFRIIPTLRYLLIRLPGIAPKAYL